MSIPYMANHAAVFLPSWIETVDDAESLIQAVDSRVTTKAKQLGSPTLGEASTRHGYGCSVFVHTTNGVQDIEQYRWVDYRWLRPKIGSATPTPLMTWWGVLFAFSMLARYHPVAWTDALDLDRSATGVVVGEAMDEAAGAVPHLVLEAILGHQVLV
jgi:hypothetical protein